MVDYCVCEYLVLLLVRLWGCVMISVSCLISLRLVALCFRRFAFVSLIWLWYYVGWWFSVFGGI